MHIFTEYIHTVISDTLHERVGANKWALVMATIRLEVVMYVFPGKFMSETIL